MSLFYSLVDKRLMFDSLNDGCRIKKQVFLMRRLSGCRDESLLAIVAELADAHGSGPCTGNGVGVRVPSMAPAKQFPVLSCQFSVGVRRVTFPT